jgi:hypothetical protein
VVRRCSACTHLWVCACKHTHCHHNVITLDHPSSSHSHHTLTSSHPVTASHTCKPTIPTNHVPSIALELLKEAKSGEAFLRRLSIICLEDSVLHPQLPLVVWAMLAVVRACVPVCVCSIRQRACACVCVCTPGACCHMRAASDAGHACVCLRVHVPRPQGKGYVVGGSLANALLDVVHDVAAVPHRDFIPGEPLQAPLGAAAAPAAAAAAAGAARGLRMSAAAVSCVAAGCRRLWRAAPTTAIARAGNHALLPKQATTRRQPAGTPWTPRSAAAAAKRRSS